MYNYTVTDADGYRFALKRTLVYIAFLFVIVSTALFVLFLLFERYKWLILCGCLYACVFLLVLAVGTKNTAFRYDFDGQGNLCLTSKKGKKVIFSIGKFNFEKKAETSDFYKKDTEIYCFPKSRISFRTEETKDAAFKKMIYAYEGRRILLLLDDYAESLMKKEEE